LHEALGIPRVLKYAGNPTCEPESAVFAGKQPTSTTMQMAQIYEKDAPYASAINVITTFGCILTMPIWVALFRA